MHRAGPHQVRVRVCLAVETSGCLHAAQHPGRLQPDAICALEVGVENVQLVATRAARHKVVEDEARLAGVSRSDLLVKLSQFATER